MSGTLFIAGGATTHHFGRILEALIHAAGGVQSKFALIVTASGDGPDEVHRDYQKDFEKAGVNPENLVLVPLYDPAVTDERGFNALHGDHDCLPEILKDVRGVWFTGGDQYFTAKCFIREDGTPTRALELLHEIYRSGGAIGGSSAGAAIMSRVMIGAGTNRSVLGRETLFSYDTYPALLEEDPDISPLIISQGLGFFPHGVVDQHFDKRPRLLRLIETCMLNKENERVGYAVSEDTCLVYHADGRITVLGAGAVYVADCRKAERGAPGCYRGVMLHAIQEGDSYHVGNESFTFAGDDSGRREIGIAPDYYAGGVIDHPGFDRFIDINLLRCKKQHMPVDEASGRVYARGVDVSDIDGADWAVVFRYLRGDDTRGYRKCIASFVNVGLETKAVKIQL